MIAVSTPRHTETTDIDGRAFRHAMGQFATGVTVITTFGPAGPHGMTANAVTSVSLDPPLLLVCVSRAARLSRYLFSGQRFAVNILGAGQEPVSRYFSGGWHASQPPEYRFECVDEAPVLAGGIGALICDVSDRYGGGDHEIILGHVRRICCGDEADSPLLFFRGQYASLDGNAGTRHHGAQVRQWADRRERET